MRPSTARTSTSCGSSGDSPTSNAPPRRRVAAARRGLLVDRARAAACVDGRAVEVAAAAAPPSPSVGAVDEQAGPDGVEEERRPRLAERGALERGRSALLLGPPRHHV